MIVTPVSVSPAITARCTGAADVRAGIEHARSSGLPLAIRGGGHNAGGLGVWDDALVVDLSGMRAVHLDRSDGTAPSGKPPHTSSAPRMQSQGSPPNRARSAAVHGVAVPAA